MSLDPMERPQHERALEEAARKTFDRSVGRLDAHTRVRLAQARARALDERQRRSVGRSGWFWLPAGAVAATVAVWLVWHLEPQRETELQLMALSDLEILLGDEDLELLEDLEFYTWLGEQSEHGIHDAVDDGVG